MSCIDADVLRQNCEHCRECDACCRANARPSLLSRVVLSVVACLLALTTLVLAGNAAAALPEDSVYRLDAQLVDQDGHRFAFADAQGEVRLASMFYATCPYVCPMLVEQLKAIEHALDQPARARLRVLLVSLEVERDTPEVLAQVAAQRRIDTARWTLAQPRADDLRKLAAVLGVQYRKLPDGEFNHSTVISLLAPDGRVLAQTSRLGGEPDPEFIAAVSAALAADTN